MGNRKLTFSEKSDRIGLLEVITDEVVFEAMNHGAVENPAEFDKEFTLMNKVGKGASRGGVFKGWVYGININLSDRYFDPMRYHKEEIKPYTYTHAYRQWNKAKTSVDRCGFVYHPEYISFDHDSEIGGIYTNDPELAIKKVIAHELAHCLVYWNHNQRYGRAVKKYPTPHGVVWKSIYRDLRRLLINNHVEKV